MTDRRDTLLDRPAGHRRLGAPRALPNFAFLRSSVVPRPPGRRASASSDTGQL